MAKKPSPEESEDTGDAGDAGSSSDAAGAAPEKKSGPQKKGSGRIARPSGLAGRASGSQRAVGGAASFRPLGSGTDLVPLICSECYEEFVFDSAVKSATLTCPICEHQAARPDDAQLAVIAEKRKQEKSNFTISVVLCLASLAAFGVWVLVLRNPHTNAHDNGGLFYGPGFVSLLLFLGGFGFAVAKYESARHEVYF